MKLTFKKRIYAAVLAAPLILIAATSTTMAQGMSISVRTSDGYWWDRTQYVLAHGNFPTTDVLRAREIHMYVGGVYASIYITRHSSGLYQFDHYRNGVWGTYYSYDPSTRLANIGAALQIAGAFMGRWGGYSSSESGESE